MWATIKHIIVAFVYIVIICTAIYIPFSGNISKAFSVVDMISVDTNKKILSKVKMDVETNELMSYPEYGMQYGSIKIPSLNVDLPLYFGDTLSILKYGVGHSSFSYFPGEGGTILCMGHNTASMLRKLPNIEVGAEIIIETTYGKYTYQVYNTKIVKRDALDEAPIQKEREILMLYTCYPVNGLGNPENRFFAYANLINEELIENE